MLTPHAGELGRLLERDSERDRRPPPRLRSRGGARPPARSSCSRATTRSSPTASGSRSTRSLLRRWPRPAPATSSPGSSRRCWPAASSRSRPPARRSSPTPAPAARRRARIGAAESVIATDVIDSIPVGTAPRRAGRIISPPMKTAAEIMDADVPSVSPERRRPRRDRPAGEDRAGRDPGGRRGPQGGRHRQRVRPDPQRRGVRPAPAALPQHHGRDRLHRLDEGLRGAARTKPLRPRSPS